MILLVEVTFLFTCIDGERELFPRKAPTVMLTIIAIYMILIIWWYDNPNTINMDVVDVDLGRYETVMLPQFSNWDVPLEVMMDGLLPNYCSLIGEQQIDKKHFLSPLKHYDEIQNYWELDIRPHDSVSTCCNHVIIGPCRQVVLFIDFFEDSYSGHLRLRSGIFVVTVIMFGGRVWRMMSPRWSCFWWKDPWILTCPTGESKGYELQGAHL